MNNSGVNDNSMKMITVNDESALITRRNQALWRSIKNLGDITLENQFKDTCIALTRNTHIKRKFIESINTVNQNLAGQSGLMT